MKNDAVETSAISRLFNLSARKMLIFFVKMLAEVFFVVRLNIVNLNNDKKKYKLDILTNSDDSKLVIASA